ncbi:deoxyguanosinetriphosphate triphosphohydrolase family protein [Paenibacillus sp. GCM10012307]|uniref:DNTP triphosphohydrolase n=1 Tax=Paenibacillus roseus TaxID=2798579 RepID=A0A934MQ05_9BACL|nr:dNTP triphosphohydrolase [Paenibacillus roseus]MBJ6362636.1 dNTP triphosphohydrolase [Paenibacillus roseus]
MDLRTMRLAEPSIHNFSEEREEYERDYARLIQSPAFRRMQGKSQVFGAGTGDYYRTRLTHSLEVSQIAREVARRLSKHYPFLGKKDHPGLMIESAVVECAALAHDLGHPPFGHRGEAVLNRLLLQHSGIPYEGNAQNFRILMFLEKRAGSGSGLDLTAAVLLAVNKYPFSLGETGQLKGLYTSEWQTINELRDLWQMPAGCGTLETQLMDLCDDIAYSTHDIEDGIRAGKIRMDREFFENDRLVELLVQEIIQDVHNSDVCWDQIDVAAMVRTVLTNYFSQWEEVYAECNHEPSRTRREMKARWVSIFAGRVGIVDDAASRWKRVTFVRDGQKDYELLRTMEILKKLAWVTLVKDFRVQRLQMRSEIRIGRLWDSFIDPDYGRLIIPPDWVENYKQHKQHWPWARFVADYISGMTDAYAEKVYAELFSGSSGSIYEKD